MPKNDPDKISALPETYEPQGSSAMVLDKPTAISNEINGGIGDLYKSRIPFGTDIIMIV